MAGDLFVATDSVLTWFEGENIYIAPGDIARAGHPILKGHHDKFIPVQVRFDLPEPKPAAARPAVKKGTGQ